MNYSANRIWLRAIEHVLLTGEKSAPRGLPIKEVLHHTHRIDMDHPIISIKERKLNYAFMLTEALWILNGDCRVAPLHAVNKQMAKFSDDGVTLSGAYGPRFVSQLDFVVDKLVEDRDTRQATLTLWAPNPQPSKDIPCTVAMDFKVRGGLLHAQVFMRSSDVWLGLPYDIFAFTCMASRVLELVQTKLPPGEDELGLGTLYLTAASSHLYEEHWEKAALIQTTVRLPGSGPSLIELTQGHWIRGALAGQLVVGWSP